MLKIQKSDFSIDDIVKSLKTESTGCVVLFLGVVRGISNFKKVKKLVFEVYKSAALKKLAVLKEDAKKKYKINDIFVYHRTGDLKPFENIVLIAVSAEHRTDAFKACEYMIDRIKEEVPIWKKEIFCLKKK